MAKSPPEADEGQTQLSTAQPPYASAAEPGPVPAQPAPSDGTTGGPEAQQAEETDVWWGSYSMATMVPSLLVCLLLTGLIAWVGLAAVPHGYVQMWVFGLAGAVWLVQGVRWAYRVFGYNYRLTTRHIFADRGFLYKDYAALDLARVQRVLVKRSWMERLLGVGKIWIMPEDQTRPRIVLEGVRRPRGIAERIKELVKAAHGGQDNVVSPRQ